MLSITFSKYSIGLWRDSEREGCETEEYAAMCAALQKPWIRALALPSWITAPPGSPLTEVVVSMQDGKTQQRWAWPIPSSTPPAEIEREVPTANPPMLLSIPFPWWPTQTSDEGNTNIIILLEEMLYALQECPCKICNPALSFMPEELQEHTGTTWHKLGTIPGFPVERPKSWP